MRLLFKKTELPAPDQALPGRAERMPVAEKHFVLQTAMAPPWPEGSEEVIVGLGCFWGAERRFWEASGVHSTQVGYAGGFTPNPLARRFTIARESSIPRFPVHAFAFPLFTKIACALPERIFLILSFTGAAFTLFVVNMPAMLASF